MHTKEQVKAAVKDVPLLSDDQLETNFKCITSQQSGPSKKMYAPLLTAVEKERRKRGVRTISAKPTAVRDTTGKDHTDSAGSAKASDYEAIEISQD